MANQFTPYAYLILFGLYETADIFYNNRYGGNLSYTADKEEQRQAIHKDQDLWFRTN